MNRLSFRIHHDNDPRRVGHIPMDCDQVFAALRRFRDALPSYLAELGASMENLAPPHPRQSAIRLTVNTVLDWERAHSAIAGYADRHGLRATRVRAGLVCALPIAPFVKTARGRLGVLLRPVAGTDAARRRLSSA
jgi:hypothetical protein